MPNEEYEIAKKERARKDMQKSIIIFSAMAISFIAGLIYLVVLKS